MSFNFNVSTNIDITKKILKFISLLKLLKFKSFCNVNQHYLIIVLLPPPPPPPPSSPFFLGGGRGGDGGQGTGGQGRGRGGTIAPPPLLPHRILQKLFYAGSFINILLFSLTLYSPCVIYLP